MDTAANAVMTARHAKSDPKTATKRKRSLEDWIEMRRPRRNPFDRPPRKSKHDQPRPLRQKPDPPFASPEHVGPHLPGTSDDRPNVTAGRPRRAISRFQITAPQGHMTQEQLLEAQQRARQQRAEHRRLTTQVAFELPIQHRAQQRQAQPQTSSFFRGLGTTGGTGAVAVASLIHTTISKDNTAGAEARQSAMLGYLGSKLRSYQESRFSKARSLIWTEEEEDDDDAEYAELLLKERRKEKNKGREK
ncbi:hypothetical protein F4678DRAFT_360278 [Xylaria arbuscula]|nr:hypothetical protein F4678DRAFT_360278 [Xylaria arbuscula]